MKRLFFALALVLMSAKTYALVDLGFDPQSSPVAVGQTFDVRVQVVSDGTGITIDGFFTFDPAKVSVLSVTPGSAFGRVLLNRFDNGAGTVDCSAGTSFGTAPPSGTVTLCTVHFGTIATGTTVLHWSSTLPRRTGAYGTGGVSVLGTVTDGSVTISAVANTPTFTPTGPPAATPTPAPAPACCGDCNGNGLVSAAEITTCEAIAAGTRPWSDCPACDCDGNGAVSGAELTTISGHAIYGCPSSATPIPGQPYAINPLDSEAFALGRLNCRSSGTQVACLNTTVLTADPTTPRAGDIWITENGGTHEFCWADSAGAHCVAP